MAKPQIDDADTKNSINASKPFNNPKFSFECNAYINLKRAERARTITKILTMVDNLISKTLAWEDEKKTCFVYDGVRLVELLDNYKLTKPTEVRMILPWDCHLHLNMVVRYFLDLMMRIYTS